MDLLLNVGAERLPDYGYIVKCRSEPDIGLSVCCEMSERSRYRIIDLLLNVRAERRPDSQFQKNCRSGADSGLQTFREYRSRTEIGSYYP